MENLGSRFKSGLIWSLLGQFGYLFIGFITNIILARLLAPREFGVLAIATFFVLVANVLAESGLSGALIRKKDATSVDNSAISIFNFAKY